MSDQTPAETLRAAARTMRERASAAATAPWRPVSALYDGEPYGAVVGADGIAENPLDWIVATGRQAAGSKSQVSDVDHIASWHPLVALAVADWLVQAEARGPESTDYLAALKVAHHYLGEPDA